MELIIKYYIIETLRKCIIKQLFNKFSNNRIDNYFLFGKVDNKLKNISKKNIFINNNFKILLIITTFLLIFPIFASKELELRKLTSNYEINIIIKGTGEQNILSDSICSINGNSFNYEMPDEIIINGVNQDTISKSYDLQNETNEIKMIWNSEINKFKAIFCDLSNIISIEVKNSISSSDTDLSFMFSGCNNLKSIDLTNFDTSEVVNMEYLFHGCNLLKSLDLSSFSTSKTRRINRMFNECTSLESIKLSTNFVGSVVTSMAYMFNGCTSLKSIDLSSFSAPYAYYMDCMFNGCTSLESIQFGTNFATSSTQNMANMFNGCSSLKSLDLSSFGTSIVTNMNSMFKGCTSLESINLNNFNPTQVNNLADMFSGCSSLKSLDFYNFKTEKVSTMKNMFYGCSALTSLNLDSFNTSSVTNMENMFYGCNSLKSLNLSHFNLDLTTNFNNMFSGCNENFVYCFNESKMKEGFKNQLTLYDNNCLEICTLQSLKYISENIQCIDSCSNDNIYKYEYNNICYSSCPNGTHNSTEYNYVCEKDILVCEKYYNYNKTNCLNEIPLGYYLNDSELKTIDKCDIKCSNCTLESLENNLCITCNIDGNYYPKFNDFSNIDLFINCYNQEQIGYYLDNEENIYKPCYSICKKCNQLGDNENNRCIECFNNYRLENENCIEISEFDSSITIDKINLDNESYLSNIIYNININKFNYPNCFTYFYEMNIEMNKIKNKYINYTFIELSEEEINYIFDTFNLDKEKDKVYIFIFDYPTTDINTATSDYDYKFILENGTELNLDKINEDLFVDIYVPIRDLDLANFNYSKYFAEQGYDIYDKNSNFYNDVCSPAYLGENDITLSDRKKDIYPNNVTLCKENCIYKSVNIEEERIVCSCNINDNNNNDSDINEESENEFAEEDDGNFLTYFLDNINYKIFKCYLLISIFDNLKNNYAFYTISGVFLVIIIINLIFFAYSIPHLKISMINNSPTFEKLKEDTIKELRKIKNLNKNSIILNPNKKKENENNKIETTQTKTRKKKFKKKKVKKKKIKKTKSKTNCIINLEKNNQWNIISMENLMESNIQKEDNPQEEIIVEDYNELPFNQAIIVDKRNIFQIFKSLIIKKLELISLFCGKEKIKIIMISEYILSLLINFFSNTLLYSDEVVSNKYHNNGELDFFVTLILSLLSNIITSIMCYFIQYSEGIEERLEYIMEIKNEEYYLKNINRFFKFLKLKFIFFLICEIIIIMGCFYYIVIFCIVYSNSNGSLIINYLSSLLEGLIISIVISIIILVTRKIGLSCFNKYLYNISKYINTKF